MTDTPGGAGPCVRGWVKGVLDRDDIRSAHWTVTPIIPIHHQPLPTTPTISYHHDIVERARSAWFDEPVNESIRRVWIVFTSDLMPA